MSRIIALFTAVGLLSGCNSTPPTESIDGVVVSVELSANTIRRGSEVAVLVTATNTGREVVELDAACRSFIFVTTEGGTDVGANGGRICPAILGPPTSLAPGSSVTFSERWDGTGVLGGGVGRAPLLPGTYRLRGRVTEFGSTGRSAESAAVAVSVSE